MTRTDIRHRLLELLNLVARFKTDLQDNRIKTKDQVAAKAFYYNTVKDEVGASLEALRENINNDPEFCDTVATLLDNLKFVRDELNVQTMLVNLPDHLSKRRPMRPTVP